MSKSPAFLSRERFSLIAKCDGFHSINREELSAELRRHFRPEFLNRVDETLIFHRLEESQMVEILNIQLKRFAARLQDQNIGFDITDDARRFIARDGYDPVFGARPLKRAVIRLLETPLSYKIISGEISENGNVFVTVQDDSLVFREK